MGSLQLLVYLICFIKSASASAYNITNILMIIVDDLRPEISIYRDTDEAYYPNIYTPNLDVLAAESIVFKQAYTQQAFCGPSRTAFLTGRRPQTTGVHGNSQYWREVNGNFTTIPQYFKENGYLTYASGKVFHEYDQDDKFSWSENNYRPSTKYFWHANGQSWGMANPDIMETYPLPCMQIRDYAIEKLQNISLQDEPFFMAVGFEKPHLPFLAPPEFFELYPVEDIYLPQNPYVPLNHPEVAWTSWGELHDYLDIRRYDNSFNNTLPDNIALDLRRAYYASVSYTDWLIGQLLQELQSLGFEENTAVMFLSDHGWHLGEHSDWAKQTNFYLDTHIPMMLKIPRVTDDGIVTDSLVENVDIFSTLVELTDVPPISMCPEDSSDILVCHEGLSLTGLLDAPDDWKSATFSQSRRNGAMAFAIHTQEYNYIKFYQLQDGEVDWDTVVAKELFDLVNDPNETENVSSYPEYEEIERQLDMGLDAGWREALPQW